MRYTTIIPVVAVLGLAGSVAACDSSDLPVTPASNHENHAAVPGAAVAGEPSVSHELAEVRAATAQFHDVATANAAGYLTANEPCVYSPAGGMGIHGANQTLIRDPALDPLRPELMLYEPKTNGDLKLVGVEYLKFVPLRNVSTGVISPWVSPAPWDPALYEVAIPTPQLFGQTFNGPMAGHTPTMPWHWDLHVWIWKPNPNGMFTQFNPSVHCS
jgi:hypothetical protein